MMTLKINQHQLPVHLSL